MVAATLVIGVEIKGAMQPGYETIFTPEALAFVAQLHRMYNPTRLALLRARDQRQDWINHEGFIGFAPEYSSIRDDRSWQVRPAPADLADRRVEIRLFVLLTSRSPAVRCRKPGLSLWAGWRRCGGGGDAEAPSIVL